MPKRKEKPLNPSRGDKPKLPTSPEQPVVPPDDPNKPYIDREPSIDPPPVEPPLEAPSEKPGVQEPPAPRARSRDEATLALPLLRDTSNSSREDHREVFPRMVGWSAVLAGRALVRRQSDGLRALREQRW